MILEMTSKRRWFSKIYSDSQENKTDTDISWTSSESDPENSEEPPSKKLSNVNHLLQKSKSNNWLNLNVTPPKKTIELSPQGDALFPNDTLLESPVINEIKSEEQSPILNQTDPSLCKEESPIISRSTVVKKIKWRCKRKKEQLQSKIVNEQSPDSSITQTKLSIDDNSTQSTHIEISPAKSELSQACDIDPFPSQHSSEVISESFTSSGSDAKYLLYHQPPPRKKRYKRGGLASQLQKATNSQSSSAAIWQHEVFLSKLKGEEIHKSNVSHGVQVDFSVIDKWKEYGCKILECRCTDSTNAKKLFSGVGHTKVTNHDTFVIVASNASSMCFESGHVYQIFPPYSTKVVNHKLKKTLCVINASRFVSL